MSIISALVQRINDFRRPGETRVGGGVSGSAKRACPAVKKVSKTPKIFFARYAREISPIITSRIPPTPWACPWRMASTGGRRTRTWLPFWGGGGHPRLSLLSNTMETAIESLIYT